MELIIKEIHSDLDGFQIYKRIAKGQHEIFLDSSKRDIKYGQYSIIGVNPFLTVKYDKQVLYEKRGGDPFSVCAEQQDIFEYLKEIILRYEVKNPTKLPFVGGAIGYLSYDFGCQLEGIALSSPSIAELPEAYFVFYDNVVILDHGINQVFITGLGILEEAQQSIRRLQEQIELEKETEQLSAPSFPSKPFFRSPFTADAYQRTVLRMRDYIREGHIYIANLTHTFTSVSKQDPLSTYGRLRAINPAPFSAYLPLEGFTALCSSPERFLKVQSGQVETRPIKGTIARGENPEEDERNRELLQNSEKDRAELLMIVDLERNDLSKVCKPASVKVTELFHVEAFATVYHLVATVVGTLKDKLTAVDCLRATFPGGSITGAPKIRAMEIIDELERNRRNLYTGTIGYFGFDGNADFNIVIRTILMKDDYAHIGVGGGITWESDAQREYEETIEKAMALFHSLEADYSI